MNQRVPFAQKDLERCTPNQTDQTTQKAGYIKIDIKRWGVPKAPNFIENQPAGVWTPQNESIDAPSQRTATTFLVTRLNVKLRWPLSTSLGHLIKLHAKTPSVEVILPSYKSKQVRKRKHKNPKQKNNMCTCGKWQRCWIQNANARSSFFDTAWGESQTVPCWISHPPWRPFATSSTFRFHLQTSNDLHRSHGQSG